MTRDFAKEMRERQERSLAAAREKLSHTTAFASINIFDEAQFAEALIGASEAERVGAADALSAVKNFTEQLQRDSGIDRVSLARASHLLEFGTATPTSRSWIPSFYFGGYGPQSVPDRLAEVFQARPSAIRHRIIRWFWEEPRDQVVAWPAWRHLILEGVIEEPDLENYYLGALRALTPQWGPASEQPELVRSQIRDWVRADPGVVDLVREGYRVPAAHADGQPHPTEGRLRLLEAGVLAPEDVFAAGFEVLADTPNRNASVHHRALIDAAADADMPLFGAYADKLLRVLTHGQPAEQAWALDKAVALSNAGMPLTPALIRPGLVAVASAGSADAIRTAISHAWAHLPEPVRVDVALAALANPKSTQQQLGLRALNDYTPADLTDVHRAELDVVLPGLAPAVRTKVLAWLGEAAPPLPTHPAFREPPPLTLRASTAVSPLPSADAVAALAAAIVGAPAEPIDVERTLDGIARFRASQASPNSRMDVIAALGLAPDQSTASSLCPHIRDAIAAWLDDSLPRTTPALHGARSLRGSHIQYRQPQLSTPGLMADSRTRMWIPSACEMSGTNGLRCARAWEAAYRSNRNPGPLLALPTLSTGGIDPEVFAARLMDQGKAASDSRYDSIGALLRLPPQCDDTAVIASLRSSSHPVAIAALASWGHVHVKHVVDWLRPTVSSRNLAVASAKAEVHSVTWEGYRDLQEWNSLTIEWANQTAKPRSLADPMGAIAWLAGPDGIAARHVDWWSNGSLALADISSNENWRASMMAAPTQVDALLAASAAVVVRVGLEDRTSVADEAPLVYLLDSPVPVGRGAHLYLAVVMIGKSNSARAVAVDLLVAQPGRWDGDELGRSVAMLVDAGLKGLGRAAALAGSACMGSEAASLIARTCSAAVTEMREAHQELGAWLETWEVACDAAGVGVDDQAAREVLTNIAVGTSKRAAAARRLLALPTQAEARPTTLETG